MYVQTQPVTSVIQNSKKIFLTVKCKFWSIPLQNFGIISCFWEWMHCWWSYRAGSNSSNPILKVSAIFISSSLLILQFLQSALSGTFNKPASTCKFQYNINTDLAHQSVLKPAEKLLEMNYYIIDVGQTHLTSELDGEFILFIHWMPQYCAVWKFNIKNTGLPFKLRPQ